jgi:hypothetical protein
MLSRTRQARADDYRAEMLARIKAATEEARARRNPGRRDSD